MVKKEFSELSDNKQQMVLSCVDAQGLAYAPYSNFFVGATILLESGEIIHGANQENASYPLCLCAERVALSYFAMHRPGLEIESIAVSTSAELPGDTPPAPPCGACRQVIMEYQQRQKHVMDIYLVGKDNSVWIYEDIYSLLPHSFGGSYFK